jgi:hypothetical protein
MDGTLSTYGDSRDVYGILVGKPEGKNLSEGRTVSRWIFKKWDGGMDWIDLAQDRDR